MIYTEIFETTNDFELAPSGKNRQTDYKISNPKKGNGLVIYVPGFGGDLGYYTDSFCQKVSEKYPHFSVVSVNYFCMRSRPQVGAKIYFEHEDKIQSNTQDLDQADILPAIYSKYKNVAHPTIFSAGLNPPNQEYQNFGIMAAIDILNACQHAIKKFDLDENNVILIGSSYGGYISNLVTKIAPGYIRAVFDNSSWANANLKYVTGRELNTAEYTVQLAENLYINLYVKTPWTLKSDLPNSFLNEKLAVRNFNFSDLEQMKAYGGDKTCYLFYHAMDDKVANTTEKMEMAKNMIHLGFIVNMEVFEAHDIDGIFIKSLDHGMGLSMLAFFDKGMRFLEDVDQKFVRNTNTDFKYQYNQKKYVFDVATSPIKAQLLID